MYKIIDIHTHTYPEAIADKAVVSLGNFYEFNVEGKGTYADLVENGRDFGVCGYLLFSVATNGHQVEKVNNSIAALAAASREAGYETVGFAGIHQDFPDFAAEIDRAEALRFRSLWQLTRSISPRPTLNVLRVSWFRMAFCPRSTVVMFPSARSLPRAVRVSTSFSKTFCCRPRCLSLRLRTKALPRGW